MDIDNLLIKKLFIKFKNFRNCNFIFYFFNFHYIIFKFSFVIKNHFNDEYYIGCIINGLYPIFALLTKNKH